MNSLLQQFYMIPSFRKDVFEVDDPSFIKLAKEDNLLYQLKVRRPPFPLIIDLSACSWL